MRILILNWRCLAHPRAGGAELVTHRVAEYLASRGHAVTLFTSDFPGALPEETVRGVRLVRRGGQLSVHWEAPRWYRTQRDRYDVVVDEVNTIPFYASGYAKVPVVAYFNQLARDVWWYEAPPLLNLLGYVLEPLSLAPYRRLPLITISQSSLNSMRAIGLRGKALLLPMAVDTEPLAQLPEAEHDPAAVSLVTVGRVVPSKRFGHAIDSVALLRDRGLTARLDIVGGGSPRYRAQLERQAQRLGLGSAVVFHGKVAEAVKRRLLAAADIVVATAAREGWGLTITEANALGTPAVVYDVPGLRDSTQHLATGIVCERHTPAGLAEGIVALWRSPQLYADVRRRAWEAARARTWTRTGSAFEAFLDSVREGRAR